MYRTAGLGIALISCTLVGCAGPVSVPEPSPSGSAVASACSQLIDGLPSSVLNAVRRKIEPPSDATAAWGDPPITLRCGVAKPDSLTPTSTLVTVNGVDWLPEQRSAGYVFTTTGRVAYVEVAVPNEYAPETEVLTELAKSISEFVPTVQ